MSKINLLDSSIYNLIAAGEVVERPASVVKELIENSIDAGAKNVAIEIKEGGINYISVSDDGSGIEEDDMKKAFLPHATSKIKNADDLESIFTLGFRGEALASISAVAKVCLRSKTSSAEMGNELNVEGGKFGESAKVSCKNGTTITVKDLFYCVPARAKFLKKSKTEEQEITNVVARAILANPTINFTYIVDGKKSLSSIGKTQKEAIFSVYGNETVKEILEVNLERNGLKISGFVGKPTFSKANRTYQTLIINGRYVVNATVQTAVSNAYGDFLMKRQYPFYVLYLEMPANEIDVNVHPNKLDVKFLYSNQIYSLVFESVSRALNGMDYIKEIDDGVNANIIPQKIERKVIDKAGVNLNPFTANLADISTSEKEQLSNVVIDNILSASTDEMKVSDNFGIGSKLLEKLNEEIKNDDKIAQNDYSIDRTEQNYNEMQEQKSFFAENLVAKTEKFEQVDFAENEIKIVGKIFNTYLIIEWGNNVYFIDQHAGHERIKYDALKKEYESGNIVVQPMLIPFILSLNSEDSQILSANIEAMKSVGFDVEEFGENTFKISSVPAVVSEINFNEFFNMFLAEKINKTRITEAELLKDSLMQLACKSAIKGGDDLTKDEVNKLLSKMGKDNVILFCPHGRPVVVRVTKYEIEKWFKRIV